jgi:alkanesulfonate monooxygenase SsuD/methylene tetrahydromethanopterin reductase-like flavin-dependent oxidoreductase (luciferase family)
MAGRDLSSPKAQVEEETMEFGMFHEFGRRQGQSEAEAFEESFALVDAAENYGLDAVWLAEIHVNPERSVCAAPLSIASSIATRTQRIGIGLAVQVLPLCHPLRLAEEASTVDQISHGRLIFGVGRSGLPLTYEAYGVSYLESKERFAEVLEIVRRAWTQERFSFSGKYHVFDDVCLVPKSYRKPHPPIRVAANSEDTFPAMGKQGFGILVASRRGSLEELAPNIRIYRDAYKAAGHAGEGEVLLRVPVYVAETDAQARAEPEESLMHFYRYLGERLARTATRADVTDGAQRAVRAQRLQSISYDEALQSKVIAGSPETVADRLKGLQREIGITGILAELNCGGLIPRDKVLRSLRLLCEEVKPYVN